MMPGCDTALGCGQEPGCCSGKPHMFGSYADMLYFLGVVEWIGKLRLHFQAIMHPNPQTRMI